MQGLRPYVQQQDENSISHLHRGLTGKAFGGEAGLGKGAVLPGQRRALGNITNRGDAENAPPTKTPAAAGPRRALGDITNATHTKQPLQQRGASEKLAGLAARPALAARPVSKAELYAEEGVERLAGKGWRKLEAEHEERADAEIDQRLLAFAALGKRSLPTFFPLWTAKLPAAPQQDGLQREVLPSLPPSPCPPRHPPGPSFDTSLDNMDLPEISFALSDNDILGL